MHAGQKKKKTFCAATRANFSLRIVPPQLALGFAMAHDADVWQCFCCLLDSQPDQIAASGTKSLPLRLGGLGIRSAVGAQSAAHWASWADALAMIHARHPAVAHTIVRALDGHVEASFVRELQWCTDSLARADCVAPSWAALADGLRPPPSLEEEEPGWSKHGWQRVAGRCLNDKKHLDFLPTLSECGKACDHKQARWPLSLLCACPRAG